MQGNDLHARSLVELQRAAHTRSRSVSGRVSTIHPTFLPWAQLAEIQRDPSADGEAVGVRPRAGGVPMAIAPWIISEGLWERIELLLPKRQRRFRYPGRKPLPDREALQGSCSCCTPGSPGVICRWSWASARALLATGEWSSGSGRVCGSGCTRSYLRNCVPPVSWSGPARSPTPATCRRKTGHRDGAEPGGSSQMRLETPPLGRRNRDPARLDGHQRQPQRRNPTRPAGRAGAAGARPRRPPPVAGQSW